MQSLWRFCCEKNFTGKCSSMQELGAREKFYWTKTRACKSLGGVWGVATKASRGLGPGPGSRALDAMYTFAQVQKRAMNAKCKREESMKGRKQGDRNAKVRRGRTVVNSRQTVLTRY
jgi:hypothetical protein